MRRLRRTVSVLLVALGSLVLAPMAHGDTLTDLLADYLKDGRIDACKYSVEDLKTIKNLTPNDIEQYAPDFPEALDGAIERRASGACGDGGNGAQPDAGAVATPGGGSGEAPAPPQPKAKPGVPQAAPAPAATPTPAPAVANRVIIDALRGDDDNGGDTPAALIALGILAAILLLGGAAYGGARWWAWEPAWIQRLRHATAEAGWRASSTWAEFTDFVRFGR